MKKDINIKNIALVETSKNIFDKQVSMRFVNGDRLDYLDFKYLFITYENKNIGYVVVK